MRGTNSFLSYFTFAINSVTVRPANGGLMHAWRHAWMPAIDDPSSSHEASFVFEDDTEVSPYFFVWATQATHKYYASSNTMRNAHHDLYASVLKQLASADNSSPHAISDYARRHAGRPVAYGICLQRQQLDPAHYPRRLRIENGFRAYLYSLIGSWGPLLLPYPWRAFLLWWDAAVSRVEEATDSPSDIVHTLDERMPFVHNSVVNYFYKENAKIWTPWMVRYANNLHHVVSFFCMYALTSSSQVRSRDRSEVPVPEPARRPRSGQ